MDSFRTISTSLHSAKLAEPIVIEETGTTRKVLIVDLNDQKKAIGETVGITIVHQRRKGKGWEDVKNIQLSSLKGGEGVKLNLDSKNTRKIYDELTKLYALMDKEGVQFGTKEFTVAKADEIIRVPKDRKTIIERLLTENYADEVWQELVSTNPDLATRLSLARIQTNRSIALEIFRENFDNKNSDEGFWQKFFTENDWIFGYGLNYQFLHLLNDQPDYGGRNYTGKGTQKGDFLMQTKADAAFTVLVEIKTPITKLLSYNKSEPRKVKNPRNDVWLLSSDLLGSISQIQVNTRTWAIDSQRAENVRQLEENNIFTIEPKGILIIGNTNELKGNESIISCFESYRRNITNPEIITFDELYERAKFIVNNKNQSDKNEISNQDDDLPF
jgi:Shedu protein SduA, C-terminal/Shedu protein SduA, N-terminal